MAIKRLCVLAAAAAAAVAGCGTEEEPRYEVGSIADCAGFGPVEAADDPRGDQGGGEVRRGDIVRAAVAYGRRGLCADLRLAGPIRATAVYAVALRPPDADRPVVIAQAALLAGMAPELTVSRSDGRMLRDVIGEVAIDGDRMTITVDRQAFATLDATKLLDRSTWQVRTAVSEDDKTRTDCAPDCR